MSLTKNKKSLTYNKLITRLFELEDACSELSIKIKKYKDSYELEKFRISLAKMIKDKKSIEQHTKLATKKLATLEKYKTLYDSAYINLNEILDEIK